jgi:putative methyltransferase (TIGR04325 family)
VGNPRSTVRDWIPPIVLRFARRFRTNQGFFGDYPSWGEAARASSGYDSSHILEKVKTALLKVKRGEASYERDSVLFDRTEYSWPLLAGLLWIASVNNSRLNVLDFGGSLGSSYFQNRQFLSHLKELSWSIVEQHHFVRCGREHFQNGTLRFYASIDEYLAEGRPTVLLLSSVLPYLEKAEECLNDMLKRGFPYIIVDRTSFVIHGKERITVQRVPAWIYDASYPCRFFNERQFLETFVAAGYELIVDFETPDRANIPSVFKGFIFRRQGNAAAR